MTRPVDMSKLVNSFKKIKTPSTTSSGFHDPDTWIDTGNYTLNYLISGDYYKGIPLGKVSIFAGESGSGKSVIVSGNIVKNAQDQGILPVIFDSENALDEDWLQALGVDTSPEKLMKFNVSLINDVANIMNNFIKSYRETDPEERPKILFVIDSLGMMTTPVEQSQFEKGDMKGDMGHKPKQLGSLVRNLVVQIADLNIGVVCTNHTYASQDMFDPDDKISGGCLIAGTKIHTKNGLKNIEDVRVGDLVLSYDGNYHDVIQEWHYKKPTYNITLENNDTIECSPEHKFACKVDNTESFEWVPAKDLEIRHEIMYYKEDSDMFYNSIKEITYNEEEKDVYDIQVEDTASYILENGVVSHNSGFIYASSIVVAIKKRKLKENEDGQKITEVEGIKADCKIMKSRFGKAYETSKLNIRFDRGLEPYSGLFDYWERLGILKKQGNRYRYESKDGTEILEFKKNYLPEHFDKIMEEWDHSKYKLKSDARDEKHEDEVIDETPAQDDSQDQSEDQNED